MGVVGRLLHLFEAGIIKRLCTFVNWMVQGVIFNVSAFALPAAVGTLVRWMDPDFWFMQLDLEAFEVDPFGDDVLDLGEVADWKDSARSLERSGDGGGSVPETTGRGRRGPGLGRPRDITLGPKGVSCALRVEYLGSLPEG